MIVEWDKDTLAAILESNNFHIEMTIEQCLSMSGGGSIAGPATDVPDTMYSSSKPE